MPGLLSAGYRCPATARRPVDELVDNIGMPGVPLSLRDHVHKDLVQCHLTLAARPPRYLARRV